MTKFRLSARRILLTYKSHLTGDKFDKFAGFHRVWHETGDTGYKHTHYICYNRKKFETRSEKFF